jgi:hypothetical protein
MWCAEAARFTCMYTPYDQYVLDRVCLCIERSQICIFASKQLQAARINKRSTKVQASHLIRYRGRSRESEVRPGLTPSQVAYAD